MAIFGKKIALIIVLAFVLSFSVGMMTTHTDDKGNMSDCPFMGMDAICQMSIFEHIGTFQSMFTGIPGRSILSGIIFPLVLVSLVTIQKSGIPPDNLRFFMKENLQLPSFNKILFALSDGTIQPKLYA
ncbi:MAG: hypothetical protein Q8R55_00090 [Candidatus Taylorbacteria bacterium]|nr:hypothetical protein [Candidatus Taylorbacteria bacterium]